MLKSLVRTAVAAALVISASAATAQVAPAQEEPLRIAVVDLDLLVSRSAVGQQLVQKLSAFENQVKQEGEGLAAKARETRQLMNDGANSLSEERLAELQKQYEDQTIAIRRFTDDKQREGQKMQNEGLQKIEKDLEPIFKQIREDGNYDLIFNRAAGIVVMTSPRVDITQRVLDMYDTAASVSGGDGN